MSSLQGYGSSADAISTIPAQGDILTTLSTLRTTITTSIFTLSTVAVVGDDQDSSATDSGHEAATVLQSGIIPWLFPAATTMTVVGSQNQSGPYDLYTSTSQPLPATTAGAPLSPDVPVIASQNFLSDQHPTATYVSENPVTSTWSPVPDPTRTVTSTTTRPVTDNSQLPDQPHQTKIQNNILAPVLSAVIPFLVFCVCLGLYFWWRHRKSLRQKEEDDLERTAVWFNGRNKNDGGGGTDLVRAQAVNEVSGMRTTSTNAPNNLALPAQSATRTDRSSETDVLREEALGRDLSLLETPNDDQDPFTTPTSKSSFIVHNYLEYSPARSSQIGLAVTTPSDEEDREIPEDSSPNTIVHHASAESDSNPFNSESFEYKEPYESPPNASSDKNTTQESLEETLVDSTRTETDGSSPMSYRAGQPLSMISERSEHTGLVSKTYSTSSFESLEAKPKLHALQANQSQPGIEIARQCIWNLKREARNAQIAAAEAERQAAKLRPTEA